MTGAAALIAPALALVVTVAGVTPASADTPGPLGQQNGCYSHLTSNWSTFPFVITGTAAPKPNVDNNQTVTLSNLAVLFPLSGTLAVAGEGAGVLSAAPDAAHFDLPGTDAANGNSFTTLGLNSAAGNAQMTVAGSNTTEGTQRLTSSPITTQFALIGTAPAITVYQVTGTLTPGTLNGLTPAPGNNVAVGINFPNSTWHPAGNGAINFTESTTPAPSSLTTPTTSPTSSPLGIFVSLGVSANFYCWPGQSNGIPDFTTTLPGSGTSLVPAPSATQAAQCVLDPAAPQAGDNCIASGLTNNGVLTTPPPNFIATIDSTTAVTPAPHPPVAPPGDGGSATNPAVVVGSNQSTVYDVLAGVTASNATVDPTTLTLKTGGSPAHGTASVVSCTVGPGCAMGERFQYTNNGDASTVDQFSWSVCDTGHVPNTGDPLCLDPTVYISILHGTCTTGADTGALTTTSPSGPPTAIEGGEPENPAGAADHGCSLQQVLVLPVAPNTLSMSQANPTPPGLDVLGGTFDPVGLTCGAPSPLTLNGQPQYACGALNPLTIVNARGTDDGWTVTGQVTDFIDGTRGTSDTCSQPAVPKNILHTGPDNHCIPGGNLGWFPGGPGAPGTPPSVVDGSLPGDTAAVTAGNPVLFPGLGPAGAAVASVAGLHDSARVLCYAPDNQSGGTFSCGAGLVLGVPGSTAAGVYTATLTLTLA